MDFSDTATISRYRIGILQIGGLLLGLIATGLSAYFIFKSLRFGLGNVSDLPITDQWAFVLDYLRMREGQYRLTDLFSLHNEHRIFTTRLVLLADVYFFSMRGFLPIIVTYGALAVITALIAYLSLRGSSQSVLGTAVATFAMLGIAWSASQYENLETQFQVQFAFVHLFALLSYLALAKSFGTPSAQSWLWLLGSIATDFLATFSLGSGFLTIVPSVAMAIWLRYIDRRIIVLVAAHAVFVAAYFWGYPFASALNYGSTSLVSYVWILGEFLGTSLEPQYRTSIGCAALLLFVTVSLYVAKQSFQQPKFDANTAVLLALAFFVVLEGALTSYARMHGLAPRYATPSVIFFMAMTGVIWRLSSHLLIRTSVIVALCLLIVKTNAPIFWTVWEFRINQVRTASRIPSF